MVGSGSDCLDFGMLRDGASAPMAAVACSISAAHDGPAVGMRPFGLWAVVDIVVAGMYQFALLARVSDFEVVIALLAPTMILFGYPRGFCSLSHVALPFALGGPLYGAEPSLTQFFGENLGTLAPRAERDALIASLDALMRASSNPFFPYMVRRIGDVMANPDKATSATR
jgi:hypothetical protein